jgi:hypothetical protein
MTEKDGRINIDGRMHLAHKGIIGIDNTIVNLDNTVVELALIRKDDGM